RIRRRFRRRPHAHIYLYSLVEVPSGGINNEDRVAAGRVEAAEIATEPKISESNRLSRARDRFEIGPLYLCGLWIGIGQLEVEIAVLRHRNPAGRAGLIELDELKGAPDLDAFRRLLSGFKNHFLDHGENPNGLTRDRSGRQQQENSRE